MVIDTRKNINEKIIYKLINLNKKYVFNWLFVENRSVDIM